MSGHLVAEKPLGAFFYLDHGIAGYGGLSTAINIYDMVFIVYYI
jgi:hypothetical protein